MTSTDRISDAVYRQLRSEIYAGKLRPGDRLSVPALAARLEVSRSPVREAVVRLGKDRLVVEEPQRGASVARISPADLAEMYRVREMLEGLAARLAVENAGSRLWDQLAQVIEADERAVQSGDTKAHHEADLRFHVLIWAASGNIELSHMMDGLQARVRLAMSTTAATAGPQRSIKDHQAILSAIRSGNPQEAEQVARKHISRLREALLEQAGQDQAGHIDLGSPAASAVVRRKGTAP